MVITAAILGVVATIAAAAVMNARDKAAVAVCVSNLEQIQRAKEIWAFENKAPGTATPVMSDLVGSDHYLKVIPACPLLGTYTIGKVDDDPTCNRARHVLPQ